MIYVDSLGRPRAAAGRGSLPRRVVLGRWPAGIESSPGVRGLDPDQRPGTRFQPRGRRPGDHGTARLPGAGSGRPGTGP